MHNSFLFKKENNQYAFISQYKNFRIGDCCNCPFIQYEGAVDSDGDDLEDTCSCGINDKSVNQYLLNKNECPFKKIRGRIFGNYTLIVEIDSYASKRD